MGQVNVNTPGGGTAPGEPTGSSGAGFILGIIIAIIVIAVLVYVLVLAPPPAGDGTTDGGDGGNGEPAPSALMVTHRACAHPSERHRCPGRAPGHPHVLRP